jgi:hypothetical protein
MKEFKKNVIVLYLRIVGANGYKHIISVNIFHLENNFMNFEQILHECHDIVRYTALVLLISYSH